MATRLTDTTIRGLGPGKELRDTVEPGLAVRRQGEGRVSFVLVWQKDGKARRHTLGRYPDMSLATAREEARRQRPALVNGISTIRTVAELLDAYEATLGKSKDQVVALMAKHVRPVLGSKLLVSLHRRDVQSLVDSIGSASVGASVGRYITAALSYGEQRGHVENAIRRLALPEGNDPRERVLGDIEIAALMRDWLPRGLDAPARSAFSAICALCLLTGARRSEIGELRWDEIRDGQIYLSAVRSKGNRPTVVVLSDYALRILAAWPRFSDEKVFPAERVRAVPGKVGTRPGRPGRGVFCGWARATVDCHSRTGTADWSPHDLRRTCATGLARAGVRPDIIEAMLNHAPPRLARTYNRHHPVEEIRAALQAWGAVVCEGVVPGLEAPPPPGR